MGPTGTHSDGVPVVAYCVRRAGGRVLAERLPDERFYAASTVKLAVLAAVARALEAGTLTLATSVISADTFHSEVAGAPEFHIDPDDLDEGMPTPGTPMTLAEVIERMVVVSSNEATNMATDLVGLHAVRAVLADAGATSTTYGCKYSDFAAAAEGATRYTTARDLAALMSAIVTGALTAPEWTNWMTAMLGRQQHRHLTAPVPGGVPFGSKSGWVDGIRHDVAFVGAPGPDALVVSVCTRGFDDADALEALEAIGQLAHMAARPEGDRDQNTPSAGKS